MKRYLIVYSEVPEDVFLLSITPQTEEEEKQLVSYNNTYINSNDESDTMASYFYDDEGNFKFEKIKDSTVVNPKDYDKVLIMGMIL